MNSEPNPSAETERAAGTKNSAAQPLVSVIVPVFNAERFLRECLDSVLAQTLREIEVICVNDGSTDASPQILAEYAARDSRMRVVSQENRGGGAARNAAMEIARGKFFAFLDGDDFFEPEFLGKMLVAADAGTADVVANRVREFDVSTGKRKILRDSCRTDAIGGNAVFPPEEIADTLFSRFQNWPWNKIFRAEFVRGNGLRFQEIMRTNDLLFTCSALACARKIAVVETPFVNYRRNFDGHCQATNDRFPLDFYKAFVALGVFLRERDLAKRFGESFRRHLRDGILYNLRTLAGTAAFGRTWLFLSRNLLPDCGISLPELCGEKDLRKLISRHRRLRAQKP